MEESNFAMFMSSVIQKLESLLTAPSGSFIFAKHSQTIKCSHSYFFRELSLYGTTFRQPVEKRPVWRRSRQAAKYRWIKYKQNRPAKPAKSCQGQKAKKMKEK